MRYTSTLQNFIQPNKADSQLGIFPEQRDAVVSYVDSPSQSYLRTHTQTGEGSMLRIQFSTSCNINVDRELCMDLSVT